MYISSGHLEDPVSDDFGAGEWMQYFLPFGLDQINNYIEQAILDADEKGVKVLSLAALNKVFIFGGRAHVNTT